MKKLSQNKLSLARETVRILDADRLSAAYGGVLIIRTPASRGVQQCSVFLPTGLCDTSPVIAPVQEIGPE